MIVWRGLGILIVVAAVAFFFGMRYGLEYLLDDPTVFQKEIWPLLAVLGLTALVAVMLDPQGHKGDSLFFIPTRFWGYIVIPLVAAVLAVGHYSKTWTLDTFWDVVSTGEVQTKDRLPTEMRNWKDRKGRVMEARLVELQDQNAVLVKRDGRKYEVPIQSLSMEDQAFIARLIGKLEQDERIKDKSSSE